MSMQRPRLKVLIVNVLAAIFAILVFGLTTSNAKTSGPTPFLSPTDVTLTPRAWLPIVMNNFPPPYSTSFYVKVADQTTLYNLGCTQGLSSTNNTNIVVVLISANRLLMV